MLHREVERDLESDSKHNHQYRNREDHIRLQCEVFLNEEVTRSRAY